MIQIEEMTIRVPAMGEEQARSMGEVVAQRLSENLPGDTGHREIDELNIRLTVSPGTNADMMADNIVKQILQQLTLI